MQTTEKMILKTLAWFDLFEFPLNGAELKKYLLFAQSTSGLNLNNKLVPAVKNLLWQKKIKEKDGFYFLNDREEILKIRKQRKDISLKK